MWRQECFWGEWERQWVHVHRNMDEVQVYCWDHTVLRAVGFHHHTVDTLEIKTLDEPSMQREAKPSGCLLTNNTRVDRMSLKPWPTVNWTGEHYNTSLNPVFTVTVLHIPANITSAKTIKNCTGFDPSQFYFVESDNEPTSYD